MGKHAFLSASNYHWVNYNEKKLIDVYANMKAKERGTELHEFASYAITNGIKLANHKKTLNMFVNDAIGYRMDSEVVLYYSDNAFGTADAICFRDGLLRIHDLKTGRTKVKMTQLDIYAAFFCLEYGYDPERIEIEQRIYQNNEVVIATPTPDLIQAVMDQIERCSNIIDQQKDIIL